MCQAQKFKIPIDNWPRPISARPGGGLLLLHLDAIMSSQTYQDATINTCSGSYVKHCNIIEVSLYHYGYLATPLTTLQTISDTEKTLDKEKISDRENASDIRKISDIENISDREDWRAKRA
jgi:hypothetical protein